MKIIIAEDHAMVREVLKKLMVDTDPNTTVVEAKNGLEAVIKAREHMPDVIVMDYDMPVYNGIYACKQLQREMPDIPVMMLSMYQTKEHVLDAFKAGVRGYMPKESKSEELLEAVKSLASGGSWFKGEIAEIIAANINALDKGKKHKNKYDLTKRETELLRFFAEGLQSAEIADILHISRRTVEVHKSNIFKKLGVRNNTELIRYAIRNQIVKI